MREITETMERRLRPALNPAPAARGGQRHQDVLERFERERAEENERRQQEARDAGAGD